MRRYKHFSEILEWGERSAICGYDMSVGDSYANNVLLGVTRKVIDGSKALSWAIFLSDDAIKLRN